MLAAQLRGRPATILLVAAPCAMMAPLCRNLLRFGGKHETPLSDHPSRTLGPTASPHCQRHALTGGPFCCVFAVWCRERRKRVYEAEVLELTPDEAAGLPPELAHVNDRPPVQKLVSLGEARLSQLSAC